MIVMGMRQKKKSNLFQNRHKNLDPGNYGEHKAKLVGSSPPVKALILFWVFGFGLVLIIIGTFGPILWNNGSCGQQEDLVQLQYKDFGQGMWANDGG